MNREDVCCKNCKHNVLDFWMSNACETCALKRSKPGEIINFEPKKKKKV